MKKQWVTFILDTFSFFLKDTGLQDIGIID